MKQFVAAAINAKYIHTGLAARSLCRFAENEKRHRLALAEFTINHRPDFILEELYRLHPDVILFSCYLWNISVVRSLCRSLEKVLPSCCIVLGGPEVSFDSEDFLCGEPSVDFILRGEGELSFTALLDCLDTPDGDLSVVPGLTYRREGAVTSTPAPPLLELSRLPFPYENPRAFENQILYYESSRGCPYRCSYCLSSVEKSVRFAPLQKVLPDLQRFLDARVRQVKFVDRTFNCNKEHTMAVWRYLSEHDNGITNFHFELTADLLDEEMITFLRTVRKGLFQFEIGVQSTNPDTIAAIGRNTDFKLLSGIVKRVVEPNNIHQHLDLIAGLPYEDYQAFSRSFNDVFALRPEQLQLGFLKVLRGSPLFVQAKQYKIIYHDAPPYEVLSTPWLPYGDLLRLKAVEELVELFYNSRRFSHSLEYLLSLCPDAFAFFTAFSAYWEQSGYRGQSLGKYGLYAALYGFAQTLAQFEKRRFFWLLKLDLCLHEKPKKLPDWLEADNNMQYREAILSFYRRAENIARYLPQYVGLDHREIYRLAHIEVFGDTPQDRRALLFDYDNRDLSGNAVCTEITL